MNRRAEILRELVRFEKPTGPLMSELGSFGWDWLGEPLVILQKSDLLRIIDRFLSGEINAAQLQEWAESAASDCSSEWTRAYVKRGY